MTEKLTPQQITDFQKKILDWYEKNKRSLPWRPTSPSASIGTRAYEVLVSEVMLQQTQAARVIPKYIEWMEKLPTLDSLAAASTRDVLSLWSGLGYNRRALYLQKCAQVLVENYSSNVVRSSRDARTINWPTSEKELMELPGIGKYTACALLCFAFGRQVAVVDTNIRKVILTQFFSEQEKCVEGSSTSSDKKVAQIKEKDIEQIADQLLPQRKAQEWNQALMDYAQLVLKDIKHPRIQKQSKFLGSDRYYRSQILKLLLKEKDELSLSGLLQKFDITQERFERIIQSLVKDKMIVVSDKRIMLNDQ